MAQDYNWLVARVTSFMEGRSDIAAEIPGWIALCEAHLNRELKTRRQIRRATATIANEFEDAPADLVSVKSFDLATDPVERLQYLDPGNIARLKGDESLIRSDLAAEFGANEGPPKWYSLVGTQFQFFPAPLSVSYASELTYWARIPALTVDSPTNWLLDTHPDVYLHGTLMYGAQWARDDGMEGDASQRFLAAISSANAADPVETEKSTLRVEPMLRLRRSFYR